MMADYNKRGMLKIMMDKIARFMYGRYGSDQLNIALIIFSLILSIVMRFTPVWYLGYLCYIPLGVSIWRMFSRNVEARRKENFMFLKIIWPFKRWTSNTSRKVKDTTHKYYKCPKCKATLRVPKGRGKIQITCTRCKHEFIKKT